MELIVEDLKVKFGKNEILKGINLTFQGGTLNSLIGINGAGKSICAKSIANLINHRGKIRLFDQKKEYARDDIAYVPQMANLESDLTVFEMVLLGKLKDLSWRLSEAHMLEAEEIIKRMHLESLSQQKFSDLSGGQKQLVIMAQSIITDPKVLLLDEPTSALDLKHQIEVLEITKNYVQERQIIGLIIMHDLSLTARYSDVISVLDDGIIVEQGPPDQVLNESLLEKVYGIKVEITKTPNGFRTITPLGAVV